MKVDLHVHTNYSFDSIIDPENAIKRAQEVGLDAIAITEHDTNASWPVLKKLSKKHDFPVILGEEIKTRKSGNSTGEIIGLFLEKRINATDPMEVIDEIKSQGGIVLIPHPFDYRRQALVQPENYAEKTHAAEVINSRTNAASNERAAEFAKRFGLAPTGGSDAHSVGEIGRAYTEAKAGNLEAFRKALEKRRTQAVGGTSSPLVRVYSTVAKTGLVGRPRN